MRNEALLDSDSNQTFPDGFVSVIFQVLSFATVRFVLLSVYDSSAVEISNHSDFCRLRRRLATPSSTAAHPIEGPLHASGFPGHVTGSFSSRAGAAEGAEAINEMPNGTRSDHVAGPVTSGRENHSTGRFEYGIQRGK